MYSPFCKLVEIKVAAGGGGNTVAKYQYNGAGIMIAEQTDTNDSGNSGVGDGDVDGYDPVFYLATDPQGRRVGVYRDTDTAGGTAKSGCHGNISRLAPTNLRQVT